MELPRSDSDHRATLSAQKATWGLLVIVVVAAVPRLVALDSVPPALHFDEAVYGLMAKEIGLQNLPLYFSGYTGREPLYMYVMAALFRLSGATKATVRLTSALIGIATLPLAYLLFHRLFSRCVGLWTAAIMGLSYWHLSLSRSAYPNILIPPIECAALYFLWRGYHEDRLSMLLVGGCFVGGVLYTYLAARFFPLTVALFFLYALGADRQRFADRVWKLLLAGLAAVVVFLPLALYFLRHWSYFWERADQVLVFSHYSGWEAWRIIAQNLLRTLGGFVVKGDPRWNFNMPGRPVFSPLLAPFFVLGVIKSLWRWRDLRYGLLIIWLLVMCMPAVLTHGEMPQSQRMSGIIPGVYALAALGMVTASDYLHRRLEGRAHLWVSVALALLVVLDGGLAIYTYFGIWGKAPENYHNFHRAYEVLAKRAVAEMDAGHTVVILSEHYQHPTSVFTDPRTLEAIWCIGSRTLVVPERESEGVVYLWPVNRHHLQKELREQLHEMTEKVDSIPAPTGQEAVAVYRLLPQAQQQQREAEAVARLGDEMAVLNWHLPSHRSRNKPLRLMLHWRALREVDAGRTLSVHLLDDQDVLWSQRTDLGFMPPQWRPGDTVYQQFEMPLPAGIPAGPYTVRLVYSREAGDPFPVIREGSLAGDHLLLGETRLEEAGRLVKPLASEGISFGESLRVLAYQRVDTEVPLGGDVVCAVTWQAWQQPDEDYTVELVLEDTGSHVAKRLRLPIAGAYPSSRWVKGEVVTARYRLPVGNLEAGDYSLYLTTSVSAKRLVLGKVEVAGPPRRYEAAPMEHRSDAQFGEVAELLGYDLSDASVRPNQTVFLSLHWRALDTPQENYKVFVHLVNQEEEILTQDDSVPANWARPTTGWQVGEVITDEHELHIPQEAPPGRYRLYVGMYDAATFARLPTFDRHGGRQPHDRLPLESLTVE
ncbi:MAG: glycosyltransferase family 39 protein [Chloroflexota bacterium]|nr:glycosyltransferase family 39 protein [Chloroflexota bacterium]